MAITYDYTIANLEYTNDDDKGVVVVHWRVSAVDGDYTASLYGTCGFAPDPTAEGYVPFESLTEADVIAWVQPLLDQETVEASLASQIEAQKAPAQIAGLPW